MKSSLEEINIISLKKIYADQQALLADPKDDQFVVIRTLGEIDLYIGAQPYHVPADKLIFISPGKLIRFDNIDENSGYCVLFSATFFDRSDRDAEMLYSRLFFDYQEDIQITDAMRSVEEVNEIVNHRVRLFAEKGPVLYNAALRNHIESMLIEGLFGLPELLPLPAGDRLADRSLVNALLILVNRNVKKQSHVSYYANELHVTPRKLSICCRKVFNKTAKQIISDTILKKVINLLQHSGLSISQIAFEMGFTDESNFRRFLKKQTGKTAMELREQK